MKHQISDAIVLHELVENGPTDIAAEYERDQLGSAVTASVHMLFCAEYWGAKSTPSESRSSTAYWKDGAVVKCLRSQTISTGQLYDCDYVVLRPVWGSTIWDHDKLLGLDWYETNQRGILFPGYRMNERTVKLKTVDDLKAVLALAKRPVGQPAGRLDL